MIVRDLSCLFLHSVKTAGTSVERWLVGPDAPIPKVDGRDQLVGYDRELGTFLQHAPAAFARDLLGEETFWRCYRFTVVRNPFSRLVSMYFYPTDAPQRYGTFEDMVRRLPALVEAASAKEYYFLPQTAYTHLDGAPCCDAVVRLEEFPASLDPVAARLEITRPLPFLNVIPRPQRGSRPTSSFYTRETAAIVAEIYRSDFETLGYSLDPREANAGLVPAAAAGDRARAPLPNRAQARA